MERIPGKIRQADGPETGIVGAAAATIAWVHAGLWVQRAEEDRRTQPRHGGRHRCNSRCNGRRTDIVDDTHDELVALAVDACTTAHHANLAAADFLHWLFG